MAIFTYTNPPPFKTNRRKCGWGSTITSCDICGKIMVGHNRGICSKCLRSSGLHAPTIFTPPSVGIRRLMRGVGALSVKQLKDKQVREMYAIGGAK